MRFDVDDRHVSIVHVYNLIVVWGWVICVVRINIRMVVDQWFLSELSV